MFLANKLNKGTGSPPDAQFNYVTMLLHGDGTNGAQNNTFLDSSTNNFTITRNGNTTQGSFSPYGDNWSVAAVSTSTNYLTVGSTVALGSSDYTVEFWFAGNVFELTWGTPGGYAPIIINSDNDLYFSNSTNSGFSGSAPAISGFIVADGSWNHYAIVRQSGAGKVFRNGVQIATPTLPSSNATNGNVVIGLYNSGMGGSVSNFRAVVGTAVYTSAFTPPTAPLTAITNTSLLTCQSNRFIDNSINAYSITPTGTPRVQRFNPFGTATAYSTSVIGGSGYFDGSGDYLTVPDNSALDVDAGNFTVEAWVYVTNAISNVQPILAKGFGSAGGWMLWVQSTLRLRMYDGAGADVTATSSASLVSNSWNHVAGTRSGNTLTVWVNGVSSGTATFTGTSTNSSVLEIGGYNAAAALVTGYISDARLVKGTAVYTGNFTPPAAPLTAISNTQFLANMTNGAIFDNAMMNDLETVGNAQISTSVVKYGTGSLAFDGTGDYCAVVSPSSNLYAFGTGDFTLECWIYVTTVSPTYQVIWDARTADPSYGSHLVINSGKMTWWLNGASRIQDASTMSINTWYHVAVSRSGTSTKMFMNGTQVGSTYTDSNSYISRDAPRIGASFDATPINFLYGYIDDLRITKGYARYTTTFTPPTAAFPNIGPT